MAIALGTGDMILRERPGVASDMSKALSAKLVSLDLVRDCSDEINRGEGDVVYLKRLKLEYTRKKLLPIVKDTINEELFKN